MTDTPATPGSGEGEPFECTFAAERGESSAPDNGDSQGPGHSISDPLPTPVSAEAAADEVAVQMLAVDARRVVLVGTALFGLAFLLLLPWYSWLGEHGHRVWLWTALAGMLLGAASLPLIRKHSGEGRLG